MRILAIGDIHGCYDALLALAAFVPFRDDDTIITLGDHIDRGPDSKRVLDWLIRRHAQFPDHTISLIGNHELMALRARHSRQDLYLWQHVGGEECLGSYGARSLADVPASHWQFMEHTCKPYHEVGNCICVHAGLYPEMPLDQQPEIMLQWEAFRDPAPHISGKVWVCGHTPQHESRINDKGFAICIDTACYKGGHLTCLDLVSGEWWQADQNGETQKGWLEPIANRWAE